MCCFNTYSWLVKRITWFGRGRLNGLLDESLNKLFQWADAMGQFNGPIQWVSLAADGDHTLSILNLAPI